MDTQMDKQEAQATPAQITSKQILQEAFTSKDSRFNRPQQTIQDLGELRSYQQTKRKEYEQQLNKNRLNFGQWLRYARWEIEHNHDYPRARSIMERALDVNVQHIPFWIQYIQMELAGKNINHARNLLERAITILPRVSKLWFLYVQTEETLKNYQMVRSVFEKWLTWHPESNAWDAYIGFETRYEEENNVVEIFTRYVQEFPAGETWNKWIEYALENSPEQISTVRAVFEAAVDELLPRITEMDDLGLSDIIAKWADWEVSCEEIERARQIYDILLDKAESKVAIPSSFRDSIYKHFSTFEKTYGSKGSIQSSVTLKRKAKYESDLKDDPQDYDTWWALITILQNHSKESDVAKAFKSSISHAPNDRTKTIRWRRYIMLWVRYALWEELTNNDIDSARIIWSNCLKKIPHKLFSFGKVWKGYAEFELRNSGDEGLSKARKILGRSIGQTGGNGPKSSIFKYYIAFEKRLGEWDRVRLLFEKWIELALLSGTRVLPIIAQYVEFEQSLEEYDRCEAILQLALSLSRDETTSKSFEPVDELFETCVEFYRDEMKYDHIRDMYRDLLEQSPSSSDWISFALFESTIPSKSQLEAYLNSESEEFELTIDQVQIESTRKIFEEAEDYFKNKDAKQERLEVLDAWKEYEEVHGTSESIEKVMKKLPTVVKKRRNIGGIEEEYMDYVFPQDEIAKAPATFNKFLENARKWAKTQD